MQGKINIKQYRLFLRKIILDMLGLWAIPQKGVHILNGHYIDADNNIDAEVFYKLLKQLSYEVDFINIQEACKLIINKNIPQKEKLVAFTFDDGFEECFTKIRPVLDQYYIKAGFFINPNFVDGDQDYIDNFLNNVVHVPYYKPPMSWQQIKILADEDHVIGAHTMDHLRLNISNTEILNYQICTCKEIIEAKIDNKCNYFAYPYGNLNDVSPEAIKIATINFKYNFTQSNYKQYFSFDDQFINRRHFEGNWPINHVKYFLKKHNLNG